MIPAWAGRPGAPPVESLRTDEPRRVGPYEIVGRIGRGGQGRVYLGRRGGGPEVAIKLLSLSHGSHDTQARRRFAQELMAARRVPQACTAVVLDADLEGEQPYIVSEYVPGPSLQQAVETAGVLAGAALERLATYTATALAAIHGARIVHRDFKPANVLLGPDGPRVVDFGIAQALESTSVHTRGIIGTFMYMAPEQFDDRAVGPPADVHAWAATMVFAATGRPPFGEGDLAAVMFRVLHRAPHLDGVPDPLRTLVERCLAKDPADRPSALQALQFLIGHDTMHAAGPRPSAPPPAGPPPAGPAPTKRLPDPADGSFSVPPDGPTPTKRLPNSAETLLAGPSPGGVPAPTKRLPDSDEHLLAGSGTPPADRARASAAGDAPADPLYVAVAGVVHTLDDDRPYTIGGPGSTIEVPGLDAPGDLIYIRRRDVWRLNVRLPGADIRAAEAGHDDRTVAFTEPNGRCVVRGEVAGVTIECEISRIPPPPGAGPRGGRPPVPAAPPAPSVPSVPPVPPVPPVPAAVPVTSPGGPPVRHAIGDVTVLGSGARADIVVPGVDVAAEHATLLRTTGGFRLRDHGKGGGTFVRGRSVLWASLAVGDDFAIGGTTFRLVSEDTLETRPEPRADLLAHEVSARHGKAPALSGVSFALGAGQFMAVVGPSGAGKSSLFRALLGELPPSGGTLVFRGLNLAEDAERVRHLIGYVPQQDHLHRSLTVRRNLMYAARLRLPADTSRRAREERVAEVCERLGLADHLDARADTLSGGERKRLSIALEILSEPLLLLLDEPTSGLDPGLDREVMRLLREIADRGCSVVVITHTPDNLGLADQVLVMGSGGRAAYVGPPDDVLTALSARDFPDLMRALAAPPGGSAESSAATAPSAPTPAPPASADDTVRPRRVRGSAARQFRVFAERQAALLWARGPVGLLMPFGLAVIGAAIIAVLAGANTEPAVLNRGQVLTMLVIVSALVGQALTYNNLVSEYEITAREYRTGLSPGALVLGKFAVFAVVAILQGLLVAVVYGLARGDPPAGLLPIPPMLEAALPLAAAALASMALGLALSALAPTAEKAVGLVTVAAIVQVALNGFAFTLTGPLAVLGAIVPSRWGVAAGAASQDLRTPLRDDPLWTHSTAQFAVDLAVLGALTAVFTAAAWLILRRRLSRAR